MAAYNHMSIIKSAETQLTSAPKNRKTFRALWVLQELQVRDTSHLINTEEAKRKKMTRIFRELLNQRILLMMKL